MEKFGVKSSTLLSEEITVRHETDGEWSSAFRPGFDALYLGIYLPGQKGLYGKLDKCYRAEEATSRIMFFKKQGKGQSPIQRFSWPLLQLTAILLPKHCELITCKELGKEPIMS
jgi:hypothetical protein